MFIVWMTFIIKYMNLKKYDNKIKTRELIKMGKKKLPSTRIQCEEWANAKLPKNVEK